MHGQQNMEETINCPVCLELLEEPKELACGHCLCRRCVDIFLEGKVITCPQCQKITKSHLIKVQTKLQAYVTMYKNDLLRQQRKNAENETDKSKVDKASLCDMCDTLMADHYCHNCKNVLCAVCTRAHSKLSTCEEGSTESINGVSNRQVKLLDQEAVLLIEKSAEFRKEFEATKDDYRDKRKKVLRTLEQARQEVIFAVNEHFAREARLVKSKANKCNEKVQTSFRAVIKEVRFCLDSFNVFKSSKPCEVVKKAEQMGKDLKRNTLRVETAKLHNLDISFKHTDTNAVSFKNSEALQTCISLHLDGKNTRINNLLQRKLSLEKKVKLPGACYKLLVMGDELWCFLNTSIQIHCEQTGEFIRSIPINVNCTWGATVNVTDDSKDVFIAAKDRGLKVLKGAGSGGLLQIANGRFHSICQLDNIKGEPEGKQEFLAIREANEKIIMEKFQEDETGRIIRSCKPIKTEVKGYGANYPQTMTVVNDDVFICSYWEHLIYQLQRDGKMIRSWGEEGMGLTSKLSYPLLCDSDSSGCLLVADQNNHRLLVLQPENVTDQNPWSVLEIEGATLRNPVTAVGTDDGKLFIAGGSPYSLYVCS